MTYAGPFTSHIARKCCRVTKTNLYRISDRNIHKFMFQICLLASSVARDLKGLAWCCGGTNCTGRDLATTQCKPPPMHSQLRKKSDGGDRRRVLYRTF